MQSKQAREDLKAILDLQVKQKEVRILDGSDIYNRHFTSSLKNISPSKLLQRKFDDIYQKNSERLPGEAQKLGGTQVQKPMSEAS
jgi:hypothetical protein